MDGARTARIALLLLLALSGAASLWSLMRSAAGIDFYQMWAGARIVRETDAFYAPATRARMGETYVRRAMTEEPTPRRMAVAKYRRNLEVLSTPFLYLIYAPMRGTYERDLLLMQIAVMASMAGWLLLLANSLGFGVEATLAALSLLLLAFEPVRSDARVVNMNHLLLLLVAASAFALRRRRFAAAGALLAVATITKPYVILVLPLLWMLWAAQRRWRPIATSAASAAATAIAGAVASSLYFRSWSAWPDWLREFRAMPPSMVSLDIGNVALTRIGSELTGRNVAPALLLLGGGAAFLAFRRTARSATADVGVVALGCVLFQFCSPLVWVHHLLLSVPLALWLLRPAEGGEGGRNAQRRQIAGGVALGILAVEPWASAVPSMIQVAAIVNVGLLIAFGAALYALTTLPSDGRPSDGVAG